MNGKRVWILARRVIAQLLRDRRTLALLIIVPLVILTIAGILIRVELGDVRIAVVNQDEGEQVAILTLNLGERLTDILASQSGIQVVPLSLDEAEEQLGAEDVDAVLVFPPDFTARTRADQHITLPLRLAGSDPTASLRAEALITRSAIETLAGLAQLSGGGGIPLSEDGELPITLEKEYRHGGAEFDQLDYLAPVLVGMFTFMFVMLLTSVSFLRERSEGTLERLLATPVTRVEIVLGYMMGFMLFAVVLATLVLGYVVLVLHVHYTGSLLLVFIVALILAVAAVNLGIFFSAFARNEFQAIQFYVLVSVIQIFLSGVLWQVEDMPNWLQPVAYLMPLTYANRALRSVMIKGALLGDIWLDLAALTVFAVLIIMLAAGTVRREVA